MNLTNYDSVSNLTFTSQLNDSDEATFKQFRPNAARKHSKGDEGYATFSPQCQQLVTDFSPPLLNCVKQTKVTESCQKEVLHHKATLVGIMSYMMLLSSYHICQILTVVIVIYS